MSALEPFDVLFEGDAPRYQLPPDLERIYGSIGFAGAATYSNFVSSIDGVVTLGATPSAGSIISGRNRADRFLMGLLRACADAVLLGAGTLNATPGHRWTAGYIFPDLKDSFTALRARLGRADEPRLVLFTASGRIALEHTALTSGATVVTTKQGGRTLGGRLPGACDVIEVGESGPVDMRRAVDELHARGYKVLLTEGGPHVMAELIEQRLLDEAFLTVSPVVAGRDAEARLGMVAGKEFLPEHGVWTSLVSARRHGDLLFLRYRLNRA